MSNEAREKADEVRKKYATEWLMWPNVESVATMEDEEGNFFIAIGVLVTGIRYNLRETIDGVPIKILGYEKVTEANGATDIDFAVWSERR